MTVEQVNNTRAAVMLLGDLEVRSFNRLGYGAQLALCQHHGENISMALLVLLLLEGIQPSGETKGSSVLA